ncbi:MAG: hypothetical protein ACPGVG_17080, partial [Mycobacterium sp.]
KSSEAVAYERAKSATRTDGIAKWRGTGTAPPMPKETRSRSASQIPIIDRARLGPWVHRHLLDLQDWRPEMAKVLRAHYLAQSRDVPGRAELLGLKVREYYRLLHSGLIFLEGRLSLSPPDT